ncbi:hypothetical protein K488DRAFT_89637 [Vararia minispora EC-137]|uniref:Uncharacterized protein n=1 Tax=Vararia minispora EC-137 TaxID=1314806 RepID=A0ACB8QAC6_9AGAM|nr:hypothetical protein K488DRAFT_89637 [Vararia minispora EC-137]
MSYLPSSVRPSIDGTVGAMFVGTLLSAVLYGATAMQCYWYFLEYYNDPLRFKVLVGLVLITDTVHQMLITHSVYDYAVIHYNVPSYLDHLAWSVVVEVFFNGATAVLVQGFFVVRIFYMSRKNWMLSAAVSVFVLAQFVAHLAYVGRGMQLNTFEELREIKILSISINLLTAITDVFITVTMCILLQKSRTGFKVTDTLITRLIIFTVNTGLLTSLNAITTAIMICTTVFASPYFLSDFCVSDKTK